MKCKITFELSSEAAHQAALNAGAADDESASLIAMGIQRKSRVKMVVKEVQQYGILSAQQRAGYNVVEIETAQ